MSNSLIACNNTSISGIIAPAIDDIECNIFYIVSAIYTLFDCLVDNKILTRGQVLQAEERVSDFIQHICKDSKSSLEEKLIYQTEFGIPSSLQKVKLQVNSWEI